MNLYKAVKALENGRFKAISCKPWVTNDASEQQYVTVDGEGHGTRHEPGKPPRVFYFTTTMLGWDWFSFDPAVQKQSAA